MILVTSVNMLIVFCSYLSKYRHFKYGLEIGFFLLICFYSVRYNYGNDYFAYLSSFEEINSYGSFSWILYEPGWVLLNKVFEPLGFFSLVIFLTILQSFVYYFFIKKYIPTNYYWIAVFVYLFNTDIFLIQLSMMRQALAIAIVFFSLKYLQEKKIIAVVALIILAAQFHKSAYFTLLIVLLPYLKFKIGKISAIIILSLFISLFYIHKYIEPIAAVFVQDSFDEYMVYLDNEEIKLGSGLGVVVQLCFLMFFLYAVKRQEHNISLFFKISIISFLFIPLSFVVDLIVRVGMYFSVANIISFSYVSKELKQTLIMKMLFMVLLILFTFHNYINFFYSETYHEFYFDYQTIFTTHWQ